MEYLNRAFGTGLFSGSANVMLMLNYVVLLAVYAYAFGSYGAAFFPADEQDFWRNVLICVVMVSLVVINVFGSSLVIRSENVFNVLKMVLLLAFVVAGLLTPMEWTRLEPSQYVSPLALVAGAMLIFLNYEGFELIANASGDVADPEKTLRVAYIGGVLIAMVLYVAIAVVVVGHLSFSQVAAVSSHSLSVAAQDIMGRAGFVAIAIAALLATSSAINASFYGTGRLAYIIAKSGELPKGLERTFRGEHIAGALITAALALVVAITMPLEAIATMGSAGFLLIFIAVNVANVRLAKETGGYTWISVLAALSTAFALIMLCVEVDENPASRDHLWILLGMVVLSFVIEIIFRRVRSRAVNT